MLGEASFIAWRDLRRMLKSREMLFWLFAMPVLFMYFIGTITGRFGGGPAAAKEILQLQTPDDAGFLLERVIKHLEANKYTVVKTASGGGEAPRRLVVPAGFTDSVVAGKRVTLRFSNAESGLNQDYHALRIRRAVYAALADFLAVREADPSGRPEALRRLDSLPRNITLDVQPAGKRRIVPTGFEQAIPAIMVMFTLLVLLTSGAALLVIERREGVLRRLASCPISARNIVLGKWGSRLALGMIQIAFAMIAGTTLFPMTWGPDLATVIVVLLCWASLCASLGLLLGNLVRTEGQAVGIGVLSVNLLAALGGCWWPIEITPPWMQSFAGILPTGWAMNAMHRLISYQAGPASVVIQVALLLAASLVFGWLAARCFRFQ